MNSQKKIRVFIVEDDPVISLHLEFLLKKQGYKVVGMATNSKRTLEEIEVSAPDIILMDVSIEGDKDGIDTAVIIKEEFNIPVVFITSFFDEATIERAKIATPFGYLIKPISSKDLFVAIDISLYNFSMEQQIKESEEWFFTSLRSITDGIITVDKNERVKFINSTAENLLGINYSIIGEPVVNHYNPFREVNDDTRSSSELFSLSEKQEFIYIQKLDGSKIFLEESIRPIYSSKKGVLLGKIIVFKDITKKIFLEHKLVVRLLYEIGVSTFSKALLSPFTNMQNLCNHLNELLSFLNMSRLTYFSFSNIENEKLFITVEEVVLNSKIPFLKEYDIEFNQYILNSIENLKKNNLLFGNINEKNEGFQSIFNNRKICSFIIIPIYFRHSLDGFLFFEDTIQSRDWPEEDIQIFKIIGDLFSSFIERIRNEDLIKNHRNYLEKLVEEKTKELQNTVKLAQAANKSKSEFLANMSHELRTPLNSIIGFSKLIQLPDVFQKEKEFLSYINSAGNHLLKIVNDILDISKMESGKTVIVKKKFDLYETLVNSVFIMMPQATKKNMRIIQPEKVEIIYFGDSKRIGQVFINLLSNAIKFTKEEGLIEIRLRESREFVEISFKDNGVGISPEHQKFIFDKFYQTGQVMYSENEGTGLGLSICKYIIESHGGLILLDSEPGKGSMFTVRLPLNI